MTLRNLLEEYGSSCGEVILVFHDNEHKICNNAENHLYFLKDRLLDKEVSSLSEECSMLKVWCE